MVQSVDSSGGATSKRTFPDIHNPGSKAVSYYTPAQDPVAGTATSSNPPLLFKPLKIRDVTFQNRIFVSPLCQYSADDGHFTAWHMAHIGGIASRGPGLTFIEATSVTAEGRITPQDSGLWKDSQADALKPVVDFVHSQGQKIAIQLAHAGRKASTVAPWITGEAASSAAVGGWPESVVGPSAIAFDTKNPDPRAMSLADIKEFKAAFAAAVRRAVTVGFDVIEVHAAHGYLLSEFLSPVSNTRTDDYGGSFENRVRLLLETVELARSEMPEGMPLFVRVSGSEWLDEDLPDVESWTADDTVRLAKMLVGKIDLLDVSSGGNHPKQHIHAGPFKAPWGKESTAFQAPFALKVKEAVGDSLLVTSVGSIRDGRTAEDLLEHGKLDAVFAGRMFQKNPGLVFQWADELDTQVKMPHQINWGFVGRGKG